MPLFERVKVIAIAHMEQSRISRINIGKIAFRKDGKFYACSTYLHDGVTPIDLEYLPTYIRANPNQEPTVKDGYTQFHHQMVFALSEFRNAVKSSLIESI